MIDPKQLRIGNFIVHKTGTIIEVTAHEIGTLDYNPHYRSDHTPIPLTPEILEGCGFVRIGRYAIGAGGYNEYCNGKVKLLKVGKEDVYILAFYEPKIQYLHQLQNLYFALTGQELTVNLPVGV